MTVSDPSSLRPRLERTAQEIGLTLSSDQIGQLETYLRLLERWNRTINLTALPLAGFPDITLDRLVREPLEACAFVSQRHGAWFDLGSGGGSPAIPMRVAMTQSKLSMVESRSRKAAFLREAIRVVGLPDSTVRCERIESLVTSTAAGSLSLVSLRAVRIDPAVAGTIRHLLSRNGELLLFGSVDPSALQSDFEMQAQNGTTSVLRRCSTWNTT